MGEEAGVQEREVTLGADDDVVEDLDAEQIAGVAEAPGEGHVLGARLGMSRGVVVDEDHRRRRVTNERSKDARGLHRTRDEAAGREAQGAGGTVFGVEWDRDEVLDLFAREAGAQRGVDVAAGDQAASLRKWSRERAASELHRGEKSRGFPRSDAGEGGELPWGGVKERVEVAQVLQQVPCELVHVGADVAGPEENHQEVRVGERSRAFVVEAFAGAVGHVRFQSTNRSGRVGQ